MRPCGESGLSSISPHRCHDTTRDTPLTPTFTRSDLSNEEREEYVAAVQCLMKLPTQAPKDRFPGAVSRFDDFVAYHMTHAAELHDPLHLFPAHKQFVWVYEQVLRNECNYTGYQPYENYDRYAQDPIHSPLYNGNASSMGGNGALDASYKGVPQSGRTPNIIASGGGGGCVTEGPFKESVLRCPLQSVPDNHRGSHSRYTAWSSALGRHLCPPSLA